MKKSLFLSLSFLALSSAVSAQETKFSGEAGTLWAGAVRSFSRGDCVLGDTYLNAKFEAFENKSSVLAEGRAGFDEVSGETYFDLKEIWLDYTDDLWGLRIGRQKTQWGKADGIGITNVICPKDYSSLRAQFDDESCAIDAARLSFTRDSLTADAYFIPFFTPSPLPGETTALIASQNLPDKNLRSAEYGLKLSGYFSFCDLSLYGFYGWEDIPFMDYKMDSSSNITVSAEYERLLMFGADAAVPLGETVLRLEAAFFPQRHMQSPVQDILTGGEVTKHRNNLLALAGLDWMPSGWTFTAQYFADYLAGSTDGLERDKNYTHGATLSISKKLLSDTLELSASGVVMLDDFDSAVELSGEYSLTDSIYLEAGGYIFNEGKEKGTYGEYKDMTSVYLKARYVF